jgi:hypothetical protein
MEVIVEELSEAYKESNGLIKVRLGVSLKEGELDDSISELFCLERGELLGERWGVVGIVIDYSWRLLDVFSRVDKLEEEDAGKGSVLLVVEIETEGDGDLGRRHLDPVALVCVIRNLAGMGGIAFLLLNAFEGSSNGRADEVAFELRELFADVLGSLHSLPLDFLVLGPDSVLLLFAHRLLQLLGLWQLGDING